MFDIGGLEMALILLVALLVVGPKELPRLLKTVGHWVRKARSLAREFQSGLDDIVREAELDEAKKMIEGTSKGSIEKQISDAVDPGGEMDKEVKEMTGAARELTSGKRDGTEETPAATPEDAPEAKPESPRESEATILKHPSAEPATAEAPADSDEAQKRA
ncbi:MAG: Sec-independent protein translocase protein TatB [Kiloniellales bacterium]|nr:Sec-independent protein translocase protein TatB [Kiloniellales bacterium]